MGTGVRGLKPQTIAQLFKRMDGYKDVRPYIGKGIKRHRMQGLYGSLTQSALVVCDTLLENRRVDLDAISKTLSRLAAGGQENYFGVFRHCRGDFRATIEEFPNRADPRLAGQASAFCDYAAMSVPLALYFHNNKSAMTQACMEVGLLMSGHPWEVVGMALNGFLVARFLAEDASDLESYNLEPAKLLAEATDFCEEAENLFSKMRPVLWNDMGSRGPAMSGVFRALAEKSGKLDEASRMKWICENASAYFRTPIMHPSQGYVLTLMPLAISKVLKPDQDFASALADTLNMGRETDKLGVLAGAWAGALHGYSRIPSSWKSGLVNAKEIRLRGEALANRKAPKGTNDLFEMEAGLTFKESEDSRKFDSRKTKRPSQRPGKLMEIASENNSMESAIPSREDSFGWRKFQRDKSRKKRDRRRNLDSKNQDLSDE